MVALTYNVLNVDPSRTGLIRRKFVADMRRRFKQIRRSVFELVVKDDVFGLRNPNLLKWNVEVGAWAFRTDAQKITEFRKWLGEQVDAGILTSTVDGKPWLAPYIESSYKKGQMRTYREVYGDLVDTPTGLKMTGDGKLLGFSFTGPIETAQMEAIYTRAWSDLKGITDAMGQKLSRTLALGLAEGKNSLTIARQMTKEIDTLTKTRAVVLARTEVIAAHAEAQLDGYRALGVEQIKIQAEWLTAGDNRVCPLCAEMDSLIFTVEEARGLIPRHPQCRCAWVPVTDTATSKVDAEEAIRSSIRKERKSGSTAELIARSKWAGKDKLKKGAKGVKEPASPSPKRVSKGKVSPTTPIKPIAVQPTAKVYKPDAETQKKLEAYFKAEAKTLEAEAKKLAMQPAEEAARVAAKEAAKLDAALSKLPIGQQKLIRGEIELVEGRMKTYKEWEKITGKPPKGEVSFYDERLAEMKQELAGLRKGELIARPAPQVGQQLRPDETWAFKRYTRTGHRKVRKYQLGTLEEQVDETAALVTDLERGIAKLPKYEGETYRGLAFDSADDLRLFMSKSQKGSMMRFDAFSSTSKDYRVVIKDFARGTDTVVIHIEGKSGAFIKELSAQPKELEVLFSKGAEFRVSKVVFSTSEFEPHHIYMIEL